MINNVDTLHSINLLGIFQSIHDLIFGAGSSTNATSSLALNVHASSAAFLQSLPYYLINIFAKYAVFSALFCTAMIIVVVIYARRYQFERERILSTILPTDRMMENDEIVDEIKNPKWKIVQDHLASLDADKWKLAIIEADIILNDLLNTLSLPGEGIGEKLKAVEPSDFKTLQKAWEAHKIRNAIAHGDASFLLNEREAKRIIGLYRDVFDEFEMI